MEYFNDEQIEILQEKFELCKRTQFYKDRIEQRIFAKIAKKIILATLENEKLEPKAFEGWIHLFAADKGHTSTFIEKYLTKFIVSESIKNEVKDFFKQNSWRGYTAVGKGGLTKIEDRVEDIKTFLLNIEKATSKDEVIQIVQSFEALAIPEVKEGIYSPWIHYLNPKLCPIVNGRLKDFRTVMGIKTDRTKSDYLYLLELLYEVKELLELEDFGLVDAFVANEIWSNNTQGEPQMNNTLASKLATLLTKTHNIILHGAPGTGKTYLAKDIAAFMHFEKTYSELTDDEKKQLTEYTGFVQFHPSYDYTDFVEGLRPVNNGDGQVGFERKDGVFKSFCAKASKSITTGGTDNFDDAWKKLVEYLNENDFIQVPLISKKSTFMVELNEYGSGLANRTYENQEYKRGSWVSGKSKFFSKEQLYNVYKGLPGVPAGGHDNYRRAIVNYMMEHYGLQKYFEGEVNSNTENEKSFVFIIDEINRGEMSKIFGELFFAIEPSYRGAEKCNSLRTQYANLQEVPNVFDEALKITDAHNYGHFFIPENVYIIGTMNDIDRSVESMDFAFRRRFTFKEITASETQESILQSLDSSIREEAIARMNALNTAITKIDGLSSAYHIGGAYFLKLKELDNDFGKLWEYHLEGLLREYLRGMENAEDELKKLKEAYDKPTPINNENDGE